MVGMQGMIKSWFSRTRHRLATTSSQEYLLWGFGLFITGYFLMPKAAGHARLYYLLVLIPLAFNWRTVVDLYRDSALLKCLLLFCCYLFLSTFWSEHIELEGVGLAAWHALLTLSFPAVVVLVYKYYPQEFDQILKVSVMLAALFATISIAVTYWDAPFPDTRLKFFGRMDAPTKASSAYAFFILLAWYFSSLKLPVKEKIVYMVLGMIISFALILSQGRGAMVACLVGTAILLSRHHAKQLIMLAVAAVVFIFFQQDLWNELVLKRGVSQRPEIWQYTIDKVGERWLFGLGFLSPTDTVVIGQRFTFNYAGAHGQLMATYRDGGAVGITLLALLWFGAAFSAIRLYIQGRPLYFALLVFGLICLIPYQDRLITRPREHWLYFWLPISFLIAYYYSGQRPLGEPLDSELSSRRG